MKQYVHNVKLSGRDTSISLEPEFWEQFRLATMERGTTIGKLLAEIDRTHRARRCRRVADASGLAGASRDFELVNALGL